MTILILLLLGLCLGSFVNALVWRLHKNKAKSLLTDRSECPHCHKKLQAVDLVPLVGWLVLRGKCRYCKKPISVQYPLVEAGVALLFVLSYLVWPYPLDAWYQWFNFGVWLTYIVGLAALFVYDLRWYILPDKIVFPLIILALVNIFVQFFAHQPQGDAFAAFQYYLFGLLPIAGVYWLIYSFSKGKLVGFGDVKLGIFFGLALGWPGALLTLFLANILGSLFVIPPLLMKKLKRSSRVPFGPFLIGGFLIAGLWGEPIINWYLSGLGFSF